jgi:glycerol-3-phosphate cytidylyltransferase
LICGLQVDPGAVREGKNSPVQTVVERYTQLKAVGYVDEIIPYNTEQDLEDILNMYHIDVRILGQEYRDKDFTGRDICRKRDIKLYFNKRDHRFSSSGLRKRVCEIS